MSKKTSTTPIIAAQAGWYIAYLSPNDTTRFVYEPIIAWAIRKDYVEPIALSGCMDHSSLWAVKDPDGKFSFSFGDGIENYNADDNDVNFGRGYLVFEDEKAALEFAQKEERKVAAEEAAEAAAATRQ